MKKFSYLFSFILFVWLFFWFSFAVNRNSNIVIMETNMSNFKNDITTILWKTTLDGRYLQFQAIQSWWLGNFDYFYEPWYWYVWDVYSAFNYWDKNYLPFWLWTGEKPWFYINTNLW